jgi:hypothetical protein
MNKRTKEEQKAIATMGGKASGKARRQKRDMRQLCHEILDTTVTDDEIAEKLIKANIPDTYGGLLLFRAIREAHKSPAMLEKVLTLAGYNMQRVEQIVDDKRNIPDRLTLVFSDGKNDYASVDDMNHQRNPLGEE